MGLPIVRIKNADVRLEGPHLYPEVQNMIQAARETAPELTDCCVVITSANDGRHMDGSLHYKDRAFDIRIWNIKSKNSQLRHALARTWAARIAERLGEDYDVILESDHIHMEYDPKEV